MSKKKNPINEFRVLLDLSALSADDTAREQLCTSIAKLAPESPLYSDPTVQAAVANVGKTFTTFVTARQTAAQSAKQYALDATAASDAGTANDKSLLLLRALVQNAATRESDSTSMAFTAYTGRPPPPPLLPPEQIDVVQGKKGSGKSRATVHELGITRRKYAARTTTSYPITPNSTFDVVPGNGKQRKLSGQPGSTVWIQFALVHGGQQSDWSAAVPVTFP